MDKTKCKNAPNRVHEYQDSKTNTIPACKYCGQIK